MKGKILDFSIQKGGGLILGEDGQRYLFVSAEWQEQSLPLRDAIVDFEAAGKYAKGEPTRVFRRQFILSHATLADSSNWR